MNKKQYDLEPCKSCGDVTCSGQCNWLVPFAWFVIICGGVLVGWLVVCSDMWKHISWFVKSMIYYFLNR
jgi:hypothetical protein